jgi:bacterioferritin-associated ferredoxin
MYICICNAVTEREIRGAASLGCATVEDLRRDLGVGDCCGKCVPEARDVLRRCDRACGSCAGAQSAGHGGHD